MATLRKLPVSRHASIVFAACLISSLLGPITFLLIRDQEVVASFGVPGAIRDAANDVVFIWPSYLFLLLDPLNKFSFLLPVSISLNIFIFILLFLIIFYSTRLILKLFVYFTFIISVYSLLYLVGENPIFSINIYSIYLQFITYSIPLLAIILTEKRE